MADKDSTENNEDVQSVMRRLMLSKVYIICGLSKSISHVLLVMRGLYLVSQNL